MTEGMTEMWVITLWSTEILLTYEMFTHSSFLLFGFVPQTSSFWYELLRFFDCLAHLLGFLVFGSVLHLLQFFYHLMKFIPPLAFLRKLQWMNFLDAAIYMYSVFLYSRPSSFLGGAVIFVFLRSFSLTW